ncbi:hypothetical protein GCM10022251_21020 [Phytohabitans flavus]|uniref:Uncharacterized protein n=1 Tax=Phytohabitans flavus TaxID=1076124 RepID=A0A6F8XZQ2_9ACTN|nr:DUF5988 family protein [Phytohabitans flavus]BCB79305.1 hypothetical protein Pflav_057150 [Phytohabitans flavus]
MNSTEDLANAMIDATLEGGPTDLPESLRVQRTTATNSKIKVRHGSAYEHFEQTGESKPGHEGMLHVYRWTMRTRVAE